MRILWITALVVFVDQATKLAVKGFSIPILDLYHAGMQLGESIPVLGEFFRLTFIENPGMAFGIDVGGKLFVTLFSLGATAGILWYLFKIRSEAIAVRFALALILGGAIGNLVDRVFYGVIFGEGALFYGKVVDFFDVDFFNVEIASFHLSRWPVFNVADASVSIGVLTMLFFHREFAGEASATRVTPDANSSAVDATTSQQQTETPRSSSSQS
jgi:signal peptidase II